MARATLVPLSMALCAAACASLSGLSGAGDGPDADSGLIEEAGVDVSVEAQPPIDAPVGCTPDMVLCGGRCVNLSSDRDNCARCGRSCFGGACANGTCLPAVLAGGQGAPSGIAVDGARVYWANGDYDGSFASAPLSGDGGVTALVAHRALPADVFVSGATLYMSEYGATGDGGGPGRILACDPTNCGSTLRTLLTAPPSNPVKIVADGQNVYVNYGALGKVESCPLGGCTTPTLVADDQPLGPYYGLAVDGAAVYWASRAGAVHRVVFTEVGTKDVATGLGRPWDVAIDATDVYFTDEKAGTVLRCPKVGCGAARPTVLAANQGTPHGIAVDASGVYWMTDEGFVRRCGVPDCSSGPTTLASAQRNPWKIALDTTSLYWTNSGSGTVMRLAKP